MDEFRSSFRVQVRESHVIELAIWFRRKTDMGHVFLKNLGEPRLVQGRPYNPRIEDIGASGMALSFESTKPLDLAKLDHLVVLIYFRLVDPTDMMGDPLSFMAAYEAVASQYRQGRVLLGLRLAYDGIPDPDNKALFFADARKYGISDLTKWCDDMNRCLSGGDCHQQQLTGLRLDRLMRELAIIRENEGFESAPAKPQAS
ncbi:hypothetical protein JCM15519_14150 [Fundidesulfovibrio butyratiphilus]